MVRKEFIMNEQIIINWTSDEDKNTLIINATINGERIVKVVNIETIAQKKLIDDLKTLVQNGN